MNSNSKQSEVALISTLPFELTKPALVDWLNGLSLQDPSLSCSQLKAVLVQLNGLSLTAKLKFQLYEQITPVADSLVEKLESTVLDAKYPINDEENARMDAALSIFRALAEGLLGLSSELEARNSALTRQEQALIMFLELHASAKVQLLSKMMYCDLEDAFWAECYHVFKLAEKLSLLDLNLSGLAYQSKTIDTIFKHILIFEACDYQSLTPREMKRLKELLEEYAEYAQIEKSVDVDVLQNTYGFNFENGTAPERITEDDAFNRYFDVFPVAMQINKNLSYEAKAKSPIQQVKATLLVKAVSSLSQVHARKFTRLVAQGEISAFLGLASIIRYLAADQEGAKTQKKPLPFVEKDEMLGFWKVPNLNLVPLGAEDDYQIQQKHYSKSKPDATRAGSLKDDASHSSEPDIKQDAGLNIISAIDSQEVDFEVIDTSIKGYGIIMKPQGDRVKVGELLGIKQNQGRRLEIGLLRRISKLDNKSIRLGIELIALESEAVWSMSSTSTGKECFWSVFIPKITALRVRDSVLLPSGAMKSGQAIKYERKGELLASKLGRLLHSTSAGDHFELV